MQLLPPLSTEEYEALKADIERNGVLHPIIVDEDGNVLDGNHRLQIDPDAPKQVIEGLTEGEKRAYVTRANRTRRSLSPTQKKELHKEEKETAKILKMEGKTQEEVGVLLGVSQVAISKWKLFSNTIITGYNSIVADSRVTIPPKEHETIYERVIGLNQTRVQVAADYGVTPDAISKIIKKMQQEDDTPTIKPKVDKLPTLIVGKAENIPQIQNETIDLIITSPPYNLNRDHWPMGGDTNRLPRKEGIGYDQHQDNLPENEYQEWQIECLKEMYRVAKEGASFFYNHKVRTKDGKAIHPMEWLLKKGNPWIIRQEIIWDRTSTHNHSPTLFWPEDERIYWMTKGKPELPDRPIGQSTVWEEFGPIPDNSWHPAPFTEELPKMVIEAIGRDGITVLDPFAGSCTTIKIALQYGYDAIGVDISREYLTKAMEENGWMNLSLD